MELSVFNDLGDKLSSQKIKVEIFLSKNAMIGLGTELIRRAMQEKFDGKHWHLNPTKPEDLDNACQEMGVFLHPNSPEITIIRGEGPDLFKLLNQNQD